MWSLWTSVIVVGMVLMLCHGILMFIVLGLSYVWENWSWWQRRRAHHVLSTCGASLAGDSLHISLQPLCSSRVQNQVFLALFISKVSCLLSRLSLSILWLLCSLFFMRFHFTTFFDLLIFVFSSFLYVHSFLFICLKLIATVMNESKMRLGIATECGQFLKCDVLKKYLKVLAAHWIERCFPTRVPQTIVRGSARNRGLSK
jgi:hypothetical protein